MTPSTTHTADEELTTTSPSSKTPPKASSFSSSSSSFLVPPHPLLTSRYHRQLLVPSISIRGQEAISKAKVLIIGLGGLGSPASLYLASAGIGTLGLVDADTVELSNLHRQIVHSETAVERGMSKVESAIETLRGINSEIRILGYEMAFEGPRGVGIVEGTLEANVFGRSEDSGVVEGGYDVVLDCTDNPATRYLISDVCVVTGRVLVSGAAQRGEGQLMRLCYPPPGYASDVRDASTQERERNGRVSERGPCYRCVFPHPPAPETVQSCSEIGILGPVVGVIGTLMAMEVLKILTTSGTNVSAANASATAAGREEQDAWRPTLLLYNALSQDPRGMFRNVGLRKGARRDCLVCGEEGVLNGLGKGRRKITRQGIVNGEVDYGAFCGRVEDVRVLEAGRRVSAGEFAERMRLDGEGGGGDGGLQGKRPVVVDVREEVEYELGAKVRNSIHIPISRILRPGYSQADDKDGSMEDLLGLRLPEGEAAEEDRPIYFLCQRGNDSQLAAQKFLDSIDEGKTGNRRRNRWIGDVVGGFEAVQRHQQRD